MSHHLTSYSALLIGAVACSTLAVTCGKEMHCSASTEKWHEVCSVAYKKCTSKSWLITDTWNTVSSILDSFEHMTEEQKSCTYFQQDSISANIPKSEMNLQTV